mgnify:CR=1 FL=1
MVIAKNKRILGIILIFLIIGIIIFFVYKNFNGFNVSTDNEIPIINAEHLDKDKIKKIFILKRV